MAKKTKSRRDQTQYPNLDRRLYSRAKQEYLDQDYLNDLNDEEKAWLDQFLGEYLNASFENDETDLHQDDEQKKDVYSQNNARNRCLYGQLKTKVGPTKLLNYDIVKNMVEEEFSKEVDPNNIEDAMINYLDSIKESSEDPQ
jgi:hypothetical protein